MMKRLFRTSTLVLIVLAAVAGLTFAGGQKQASAGSTKTNVQKFSFWLPTASSAHDAYYSQAVKSFMKANPGIKVDITWLPTNAADIATKLNAAVLSGTYPDVFLAYLVFIGTRGSRGEFANLDSYINNWSEKSDLFPSTLQMGKYQNHYIGLGFAPAPEVLVYRKDFFKEAGLNPNNPPTTWQQLANDAVRLTKRDSSGNVVRAGFDIPAVAATVFFEPFMRQAGCKVINEVTQVPTLDAPGCVSALRYLTDLYKKNVSIPYNFQKPSTYPFLNGKSAMSYLRPAQISSLIKAHPKLANELGYAPVIGNQRQVDFCGYRLFTIGANSKHKAAGWKFIKFMMTSSQVWKRYQELKIPVVLKSLQQKFVQSNPAFNSILVGYVKHGKGKALVPWTTLANKYENFAWEESITGKMTPAKALQEAQSQLVTQLKQAKS